MIVFFGSFGVKSLSCRGKFVNNINGNPHSPQVDKIFFPNFYKIQNLYILMDIYFILSKKACLRSSRSDGYSMKRPLIYFKFLFSQMLKALAPKASNYKLTISTVILFMLEPKLQRICTSEVDHLVCKE
jgi:hypothetical protein